MLLGILSAIKAIFSPSTKTTMLTPFSGDKFGFIKKADLLAHGRKCCMTQKSLSIVTPKLMLVTKTAHIFTKPCHMGAPHSIPWVKESVPENQFYSFFNLQLHHKTQTPAVSFQKQELTLSGKALEDDTV